MLFSFTFSLVSLVWLIVSRYWLTVSDTLFIVSCWSLLNVLLLISFFFQLVQIKGFLHIIFLRYPIDCCNVSKVIYFHFYSFFGSVWFNFYSLCSYYWKNASMRSSVFPSVKQWRSLSCNKSCFKRRISSVDIMHPEPNRKNLTDPPESHHPVVTLGQVQIHAVL